MKLDRDSNSNYRSERVNSRFQIGVDLLEEPTLVFADDGRSVDPKMGMGGYGPFGRSLGQHPVEIKVGMVGTGRTISEAKAWLKRCSYAIEGIPDRLRQHPGFPGLNLSGPFSTTFNLHPSWESQITERELERVLEIIDRRQRFQNGVNLIAEKVRVTAERDHQPDVIVCALPKSLTDACWSVGGYRVDRPRLTKVQRILLKRVERDRKIGQGNLFPEAFELWEDNGTELAFRDFRRALKASVMKWRCPIQIVRQESLHDGPSVEDPATRAWNFCTALYFKAGGLPWKVEGLEPGACFIGVSFYRHVTEREQCVYSSLAQVFTDRGDAIVVRGEGFEWDPAEDKSPHLSEDGARKLMQHAIEKYREFTETMPTRVVVHKSSRYWDGELRGFRSALEPISRFDLASVYQTGLRFFREGNYPPIRGTLCRIGARSGALYTLGFVPFLGTYPGPYVPEPIEIVEHHGDSSTEQIASEILALTKMNWNSAAFSCAFPITLFFARKVGQIMSEIPENEVPHPSYRFYI